MTYSVDLRQRVVRFVQEGGSKTGAARYFRVSLWCVRDWCSRPDLHPVLQKHVRYKLDWDALSRHVLDYPDALLHERATHFGVHPSSIGYACSQLHLTHKKKPCGTKNEILKLA